MDVFNTASPSFHLDARLEVNFDNFLYIGESYSENAVTGVTGDALFVIDYESAPVFSLLVKVEGAFYIPALKTWGDVDITVNDNGLKVEGEISFLDGALTPDALIEWDWDFTKFYAELGDIVFVPFILEFNEVIIDVNTSPLILKFGMSITVLSFADFAADFTLEETDDGLFVEFELVADVELITTTVTGDAILALPNIEDTDFGDFSVTIEPGPAMEVAIEWFEGAIEDTKQWFLGIFEGVEAVVVVLVEGIQGIIESLDFVVEAFDDFTGGLEALLNGDIAGFAEGFAEGFETLFEPEKWKELGQEAKDFAVDLGFALNDLILGSIGISDSSSRQEIISYTDKDDNWLCNYIAVKTYTTRCWDVCGFLCLGFCDCTVCDTQEDTSERFIDPACVEEKEAALDQTRNDLDTIGYYGAGEDRTREGNAAILNENRMDYIETDPQFNDITGKVPYNKDRMNGSTLATTLSGMTKVLDNNAESGYSSNSESFEANVNINFPPPPRGRRHLNVVSSAFGNSITAATSTAAETMYDTVNKNMDGLDSNLEQFDDQAEPLKPLELSFTLSPEIFSVLCTDIMTAKERKPSISSYDMRCGELSYLEGQLSFNDENPSLSSLNVPTQYDCGTLRINRRWKVTDKCENLEGDGKRQGTAIQTIYSKPVAPIFTNVPWKTPVSCCFNIVSF